jgi:DNA-binding CsgD family transcriptional regulator/PAS domain-containing protein
MGAAERLSSIVSLIYDAALDASLWPSVLEASARFAGGSAASLFVRDSAQLTGDSFHQFGVDPAYRRLYFDSYIKVDPLNATYLLLEIGEVTSSSLIIPHDEFVETRFYREWVRPQGWVDNIITVIDKSITSVAAMAVFRHERDGLADTGARDRLRLLAPHLRRAVLIGKTFDLQAAQAATLIQVLDGIRAGVVLVDADGRIVHANAAGSAILAAGDYLRSAGGRLSGNDGHTTQALRTVFVAAGGGDTALGVAGIALPLVAGNGEHHVAHVLPLTSGGRQDAGSSAGAVAALFIHRAALATPSLPEVIAKTYKLTPSELRVLLGIVEIGGIQEVAEALGIGETTVKFHLRGLFEKTGAHRQADLVKLVAGYSSPLVAADPGALPP